MKKIRILYPLFTLLLLGNLVVAQQIELVSPSLQKEIIAELSLQIKQEYVLEDIGLKMSTHLDSIHNTIAETDLDAEVFINLINQELRSIYVDKHLGVVNKEKFAQLRKMFGLDVNVNEQNKQKEHHAAPQHQSGHNASSHKGGHESHAGPSKATNNELAGSRVINRDGRTNIGLLKLTRFNSAEKSIKNMRKLFTNFVGVDAIIIDLRNCKGGDADMVKELSSYFFDSPTYLVSTIGRKNENGDRKTTERWTTVNELSAKFADTPLYIMTSSKTFSAAESFTFGLQLNDRVKIIGENTGGGGHMNTFFALPGGYGASISVGRTFDGKTGKGFQTVGVQADIQVEADHAFASTLELIKQKRKTELAYDDSKENVHQMLQELSEAWYTGDVKSAEMLLYNKCKVYLRTENKNIINEVNLLKLIKDGAGTKTPREVRNREISIYEVRNDKTAIARLMFRDQIHYLHLINDNGSWKIISDLITKKEMHG